MKLELGVRRAAHAAVPRCKGNNNFRYMANVWVALRPVAVAPFIYREKESPVAIRLPEIHDRLSYPDSNQDRQNQKLQCYHYTIRQSMTLSNQIIR